MTWRVTEKDQWGPVVFIADGNLHEVSLDEDDGELMTDHLRDHQQRHIPRDVIDRLLRAHDLRTKAPGTGCMVLHGDVGKLYRCFKAPVHGCHGCGGTGRDLTHDELAHWLETKL